MGSGSRAKRTKKRLACTLLIEGNRLAGIVLDLSATGFFVQTSANPKPGTRFNLELDLPGEPERALLAVRVARKEVSLCGDMGSDPTMLPSLLGTGLRTISVAPAQAAGVKLALSELELKEPHRPRSEVITISSTDFTSRFSMSG